MAEVPEEKMSEVPATPGQIKNAKWNAKNAWGIIRRFPISSESYDKDQKFLKLKGALSAEDLPGRAFGWAHAAPLKLGRTKHGKVVVWAKEGDKWKVVVPKGAVEDFCRDAILNPNS